ncbi:ribonuclease MRP protein subunit POP4 isoform X2 [Argentina anserina]|uniref:ribonuclease MRP protein subunit POP4 isoform X2 n=1 Tax=Argentina anserina TaxID=57926 RepID=UPI00217629D3|nr:ribonuclease MRP protein subunit POP4 isoform X2 [Potentilla anserina]
MAGEPMVQDQRQRTLQALERRFEAAKAELDFHQTKNTKRLKTEGPPRLKPHAAISSAIDSSPKLANTPKATPSKKGNFTFTGYVNSQDIDENGPTYAKLSHPIDERLLAASNVEVSGREESKVRNVLHELFQSGDSAQKYMQGSKRKDIGNWMLLDNYVKGRGASGFRARALQRNSKRSRKRMSMKQQKKNGLFDFPRELHSYDKFKPMHEMWKGYITQLLKTTGKTQLAQSLLIADLHGAIISVVDCKVTSYTGVSGIMIRETAETFGIITEDDKFRVVPKRFSVFVFQVDCLKITLHGDKLTSRNLGS